MPSIPITVIILAAAFIALCFWLADRPAEEAERLQLDRAERVDLDREIRTYIKRRWRETQRARRAAA